ncbi:MAG: tyrosine-type recombinase/integrase [FCB group bacterium]|nr:tyrosine-type recombinase/integrase [FCB group bacterium]MBL7028963.1 tyrosine-type recombinase/integrase [Candidatus Neomarinimicrobiota bacterium]MBL7121983.1 tyrosine-type recombinase/integrase [Candidatus Neomarinimicrobiota bacterium]
MNPNWVITPKKFMNPEEVRSLRRVAEDAAIVAERRGRMLAIRDWMILDLALQSGLRVSELAALKEEDLFLRGEAAMLTVVQGKGGKTRNVRLTPDLRSHLRKYLHWKHGIGKTGKHVFFSDRRDQMSIKTIENVFKKYSRLAGIIGKTIHSTRHTFATQLLRKTKNLKLVQQMLGHASLQTTQVYLGVVDSDLDKAFSSNLWD